MTTAARIFGGHVGSTAPLFLAFLAVHVVAGLTAVITVVFATATVLAAMRWRQDYYLFIIGAVAFTAATIGYQHRRRHRPGDTGHIVEMGAGYVAMPTAFHVDNGPHLPLWDYLPALVFWLLPWPSAPRSSPARSCTPGAPRRCPRPATAHDPLPL